MEKIWIECQKCGSIFWVFSSEIGSIYPKRSIDYQICSACEEQSKNSSNVWIYNFNQRAIFIVLWYS